MSFRDTYGALARGESSLQSLFLLIIRLYWGWQFLIGGFGKLINVSQITPFFEQLGFPLPAVSVILAGSAEFFGGICLLLGLFSSIATIPLVITMVVAYLTAHRESVLNIFSKPEAFLAEGPFLFMLVSLIVMLFGPGKYSLDHLIFKEKA